MASSYPGYRVLSTEKWYGPGYCGICGSRNEEYLIPRMVRWWDSDDGWKRGVLCFFCTQDAKESKGPQQGDYAYPKSENSSLIDGLMELGDLDGLYTFMEDLEL